MIVMMVVIWPEAQKDRCYWVTTEWKLIVVILSPQIEMTQMMVIVVTVARSLGRSTQDERPSGMPFW